MRKLRILCRLPFVRSRRLRERLERVSHRTFPQIIKIMESERPFLDEGFTLNDLCELVGSNRTYVSNSLRLNGTNFTKLVGEYRCRYLSELVEKSDSLGDLEDIAFLAGFPSSRAMIANLKKFAPDVYVRVRQIVKNNV